MKYTFTDPYKYKVYETFSTETGISIQVPYNCAYFWMGANGLLTLYPNYAWNGANYAPDNKHTLTPSAVHDCLYQLIQLGVIPMDKRRECDQIFADMCRERGMPLWLARFAKSMLGRFGESSARHKPMYMQKAP